ncbi:MAG: carbohydrate-binding protein, partial [Bacteroidaceae bacterium]|nr:carbohydrate-binding protein [Bacteroidaceae bacterium]
MKPYHSFILSFFYFFILSFFALSLSAQPQRSEKRGLCENNPHYTRAWADSLKVGISWTYNWATTPNPDGLYTGAEDDILFAPMCWNHRFDERKLRNYLDSHPSTKILLGYNEPNFTTSDGGSNIIPSVAAQNWPKVEQIAEDYGLTLVSPAMNFGYQKLSDGKVWGLDEWLGAFIEEYQNLNDGQDPRMDCIALHTYMNWASAVDWYVNEYLYSEERDPRLLAYFERNGRKKVMLTEFCAWEGDKDGFVTTEESQTDQMVEKVRVLEQSPNVAGYAWYMGIGGSFTNNFPYYHIFGGSDKTLQFTDLGLVYTHMSSFDTLWHYKPGQMIAAKDYIDMRECKLRPSTDEESPYAIELTRFQQYKNWRNETITPYVEYLINVGSNKRYTLSMRLCNTSGTTIDILVDGKKKATARLASTGGEWATQTVSVPLTPGNHKLRLNNVKQSDNRMNWLRIEGEETDTTEPIPDGIKLIENERLTPA